MTDSSTRIDDQITYLLTMISAEFSLTEQVKLIDACHEFKTMDVQGQQSTLAHLDMQLNSKKADSFVYPVPDALQVQPELLNIMIDIASMQDQAEQNRLLNYVTVRAETEKDYLKTIVREHRPPHPSPG